MLELKGVTKFYNSNGVITLGLRNINLKLNKGEIVAITGDSGSGKSTLLNVMTGVDTYEEGEILFYGNETSYFDQNDMDAFRKNNVSFIYQKYNIIDSYTVLQNVMIPLLLKGEDNNTAKQHALEIIERVGLTNRTKHKGSKLSGGEKQRCVIARALASDSEILACDEPTGNLDSKTGEEIIELIKEIAKDKLVLIVTHNYDQVKDIVTRRIKLSDGEIVEDVVIDEVEDDEASMMNLKTEPIKKGVLARLSGLNLLSTPKKTTLVSLVFLVVSFIGLVFIMLSFSMASTGYASASFKIQSENRLIVYNKDRSPLDTVKLSKFNPHYNPFYEDTSFVLETNDNLFISTGSVTNEKINYKIVDGVDPKIDGEALIVIPESWQIGSEYSLAVGNALYLHSNYGLEKTQISNKVTGYATSADINSMVYYIKGEINPYLIKEVILANLLIRYKDSNMNISIDDTHEVSTKPTIHLPKGYDKRYVELKLLGLYDVTIKNLEYVYEAIEKPFISYPDLNEVEFDLPYYEASIYASDVDSAKNDLMNKGFEVSVVSKSMGPTQMDYVLIYLFMFITLIALIGLFFVSYAIISRIYLSKSKDYSVLRALGVVKHDLGFIVKLETISLCLMSTVISLIITIILKYACPKTIFHFFSFGIIPVYLIVMLLFSWLLAKRFNSHLFKFSLNTTLKDGDK